MGENDIIQILAAISEVRHEMNAGFNNIYGEIGKACDRIKPLEDDKIERDTEEKIVSQIKENEIDWGKWSIRGLIAFVALQLAPGLWNMGKRIISELLGLK